MQPVVGNEVDFGTSLGCRHLGAQHPLPSIPKRKGLVCGEAEVGKPGYGRVNSDLQTQVDKCLSQLLPLVPGSVAINAVEMSRHVRVDHVFDVERFRVHHPYRLCWSQIGKVGGPQSLFDARGGCWAQRVSDYWSAVLTKVFSDRVAVRGGKDA